METALERKIITPSPGVNPCDVFVVWRALHQIRYNIKGQSFFIVFQMRMEKIGGWQDKCGSSLKERCIT